MVPRRCVHPRSIHVFTFIQFRRFNRPEKGCVEVKCRQWPAGATPGDNDPLIGRARWTYRQGTCTLKLVNRRRPKKTRRCGPQLSTAPPPHQPRHPGYNGTDYFCIVVPPPSQYPLDILSTLVSNSKNT